MFRKHYFAIFYSILLTAFTVYMALDTFVITRVYAAAPSAETSTSADENNVSSQDNTSRSAVSTETAYQDENISVTITEYREYDTSIYVADVRLSSPEYLKTALAQNAFGKNVTAKTSEMALANNAVLAINGDYYGAQENGYVLRNGVLYRDTAQEGQEDLVIYEDGSFEIIVEDQVAAQELLDKGA